MMAKNPKQAAPPSVKVTPLLPDLEMSDDFAEILATALDEGTPTTAPAPKQEGDTDYGSSNDDEIFDAIDPADFENHFKGVGEQVQRLPTPEPSPTTSPKTMDPDSQPSTADPRPNTSDTLVDSGDLGKNWSPASVVEDPAFQPQTPVRTSSKRFSSKMEDLQRRLSNSQQLSLAKLMDLERQLRETQTQLKREKENVLLLKKELSDAKCNSAANEYKEALARLNEVRLLQIQQRDARIAQLETFYQGLPAIPGMPTFPGLNGHISHAPSQSIPKLPSPVESPPTSPVPASPGQEPVGRGPARIQSLRLVFPIGY